MAEVDNIADYIRKQVGEDANFLFSCLYCICQPDNLIVRASAIRLPIRRGLPCLWLWMAARAAASMMLPASAYLKESANEDKCE